MPIKSRWTIDVPDCSLPSYLLGSPTGPLDDLKPQFLDAANPARSLTLASYRLWCQRFAAGLCREGLASGERVLVMSANDLMYPVVFLGIIMAGGVFTGSNPNVVAQELAHQLRDSDATFLICNEVVLDTGVQAAEAIGMSKDKIFIFNSDVFDGKSIIKKEYRHWSELILSEKEGNDFIWDNLTAPEACHKTLALNYSSGTTGLPKGVEITHKNYVENTAQMSFRDMLKDDWYEKHHLYRQLCFLPLYHAMAQTIFLANSIKEDVPTYIMEKYDFEQILRYTELYGISSYTFVPPIVVRFAKDPIVKRYNLSSVLFLTCGAAPLSEDVIAEAEAKFPQENKVNIKQGWGMTETTCSILGWDANETCHDGSVGEPNANCEIAIMPPSTEVDLQFLKPELELPRYTPGELWARGANIMKGYWRNPAATAVTKTQDGWLKSGDICYVDDRNHVFIVDRLKELIKVKGLQVAPAEVEATLLRHKAIVDVGVIGVPNKEDPTDELVRAYVVLTHSQSPNENREAVKEDIVAFLKANAAKHKWITGGVKFVDEIPKNPSGKILRRKLKDMAKEEEEDDRTKGASLKSRL